MASLTRKVIAMLAMLVATAMAQPQVSAAEPLPGATGARAEVQIGLCAPIERIVQAFDLRPRGTPISVWLFDDASLTLFARGLRLRLRAAADGRSVLTLKAADQDCARLDPKLVPPGEGKCEYDVHGKHMAGAVSLDLNLNAKSTSELLDGRVTLAQLLSPPQVRYLREIVGTWPLPPGIRKLGPMQVRTYRAKLSRYDVDILRLPDGEQYAEISRKVLLRDASRTMGVMEADLSRVGIEVCADQSSQAANKLHALLR